jgi:uncharacterized protein (DUF1697 family)
MKRWAAMLRGINLGKRQLKSAELKAVVEGLGFTDVKTILASGNVVFSAEKTDAAMLEHELHEALEKDTGLKSDVFVRDRAEIDAAMQANPFPEVARDRPSQLVVMFHRDPVEQAPLDALAEIYDGPERLACVGRELFIDFPNGQGESKLIAAMPKAKFSKRNTGRNWNTVAKILAALDG